MDNYIQYNLLGGVGNGAGVNWFNSICSPSTSTNHWLDGIGYTSGTGCFTFSGGSPAAGITGWAPNVLIGGAGGAGGGTGGHFWNTSSPFNNFLPTIYTQTGPSDSTSVNFVNWNNGSGGTYQLCTTALCGFNSYYLGGQPGGAPGNLDQGANWGNLVQYINGVNVFP